MYKVNEINVKAFLQKAESCYLCPDFLFETALTFSLSESYECLVWIKWAPTVHILCLC